VATGEEKQKEEKVKGFAGLASLVSDVDITPPLTTNKVANRPQSPDAPLNTGSAPEQSTQAKSEPIQPPSQPSSNWFGTVIFLFAGLMIGVVFSIAINVKDRRPSSPVQSYSPPAQSTSPSYPTLPVQPKTLSRPEVMVPPTGTDLVLSTSQIRYCLMEKIRLDGAKAAVNNYSDSDVERFNAMVADYNSRCGSFRYQRGALESAQQDIAPYQNELQAEGRSRFSHTPTSDMQPQSVGTNTMRGHMDQLENQKTQSRTMSAREQSAPVDSTPPSHEIDQMIQLAQKGWGENKSGILSIGTRLEDIARLQRSNKPSSEAQKNASAENARGLTEIKTDNVSEAIDAFQKAVNANPVNVEFLNNLGYAYLQAGNYALAEQWLINTLKLSPRRTNAWANLGTAYAERGDTGKATACYDLAYRFSKNTAKTRKFLQSSIEEKSANVAEAARKALQEIDKNSENVHIISETTLTPIQQTARSAMEQICGNASRYNSPSVYDGFVKNGDCRLEKMTDNNDCYKQIYFEYPVLGQPAIDRSVRAWVESSFRGTDRWIHQACSGVIQNCINDKSVCGQYYGLGNWTYEASPEKIFLSPGAVSIAFVTVEYAGGAHESYNIHTLILNKDGRKLGFEDLFTRTEGLWQFFSNYCYRTMYNNLKKIWEMDPNWPKRGLAPTADSFQNVLVTPQGLTFLFHPYQVASKADGEQRCDIPLKDLAIFAPKPGIWK